MTFETFIKANLRQKLLRLYSFTLGKYFTLFRYIFKIFKEKLFPYFDMINVLTSTVIQFHDFSPALREIYRNTRFIGPVFSRKAGILAYFNQCSEAIFEINSP